MRHLLLAILIVLLPLRAWAGDAMATLMAAPGQVHPLASASVTSAHAHTHTTQTPLDGRDDAGSGSPAVASTDCAIHAGSGHSSPSDLSHCQSCVVCQVCHTVGLAVPILVFAALSAAPQLPLTVVPGFTSAERALGLKPPIS